MAGKDQREKRRRAGHVVFAFTFVTALFLTIPSNQCAQSTFKNCKAEGRGKKTKKNPTGKIGAKTKAQNVLKNRDDGPSGGDIDDSVTLAELLKKSNDKKFQPTQGVEITGYVVSVAPGGAQESCNCSRKDLQDIHIDVVLKKNDASNKRKHVIVEITPKFQAALGNLKAVRSQIKGQWVKFTGWLFYDSIHANAAENTAPHHKGNWRATVWEVHPVSKFEIVAEP
jgi:hypothetical protein